jgi:hypothetical protein
LEGSVYMRGSDMQFKLLLFGENDIKNLKMNQSFKKLLFGLSYITLQSMPVKLCVKMDSFYVRSAIDSGYES